MAKNFHFKLISLFKVHENKLPDIMKYFHNKDSETSKRIYLLGLQQSWSAWFKTDRVSKIPLAKECMTHCFRKQWRIGKFTLTALIFPFGVFGFFFFFKRHLYPNGNNFYSFYGLLIKVSCQWCELHVNRKTPFFPLDTYGQ